MGNFEELKISYYLTQICKKCSPYGKTSIKELNLMVESDENDFIACDNIDTIFRGKFESTDTRCTTCDYSKSGKLLTTKSLKNYISNIKYPTILFVLFHTKDYGNLIKLNSEITNLFKSNIRIYGIKYILHALVFMPTDNHFTAEIINLEKNIDGLDKNKNYFYDGLNSNGLIENDEQLLEDIIKNKINI